MTWSKSTQSPVQVSAWATTGGAGITVIQLTVGTQIAYLSLEDAGSLGGYLLTYAPDKGAEAEQPE